MGVTDHSKILAKSNTYVIYKSQIWSVSIDNFMAIPRTLKLNPEICYKCKSTIVETDHPKTQVYRLISQNIVLINS